MRETFLVAFGWFVDLADAIVWGLNEALQAVGLTDIKNIDLSLRLLSDNPIVELDLYSVLVYLLTVLLVLWLTKLIIRIIKTPLRMVRL